MKASALHIVFSLLLLLSYGAERLLPCSGPWDVDCGSERRETALCTVPDVPAHFDLMSDGTDTHGSHSSSGEHSDAPADHGDHGCNCPCHAAAIASVSIVASYISEHAADYGARCLGLLHTTLSPPDHIPIG